MRRLMLLLAAIGVLLPMPSPAFGQALAELRAATPRQTADGQTAFWTRTLGLSRTQALKIREINLRYAKAMQPTVESALSDSDKLRAVADYESQRETELLEVLTPEQQRRYQAFEDQAATWAQEHIR